MSAQPNSCHVTDIDGVTTFWVGSDRPTLTASLMFRQGQADETLATRGWTHLLEHLALHGRDGVHMDVNGSVGLLITSFDAHGRPDDVAAHLASLAAWLREPVLDRFEHEAGILQAESAHRPAGALPNALVWRYGATGPGLCGFVETGLGRADKSSLQALAARAFTTGNAVLCLDGPPPVGLSLHLPPGPLRGTDSPVPCDDPLPRRAAYRTGSGDLCISGVTGRSSSSTTLGRILQRRLKRILRDQRGISYSPWHVYEALSADIAILAAGADLVEDAGDSWLTAVIDEVETLALRGPTPAEVDEDTERFVRELQDPRAAPVEAWQLAHAHLIGREARTLAELVAEARRVSPESVQDVAAQLQASLLLGLPPWTAAEARPVHWMVQPDQRPVPGRSFRAIDHPVEQARIVLGDAGIQLCRGDARQGVTFDNLAGMLAFPDGGRLLIDRDAYHVTVEPTLWRHGLDLVSALDSRVLEALRLPMPARASELIPQPGTTRWQRARARLNETPVAVVMLAMVCLGVVWAITAAGIEVGRLLVPVAIAVAFLTSKRARAT